METWMVSDDPTVLAQHARHAPQSRGPHLQLYRAIYTAHQTNFLPDSSGRAVCRGPDTSLAMKVTM